MFGSWEGAIEYAGLEIDKVRKDIDSEAYKGHMFEELDMKLFWQQGEMYLDQTIL